MHPETVYQKLLEKGNKNFTNGTISLDRARAVYLFNEEQNKFIENSLQKRSNFDIQDIRVLLSRQKLKQYKLDSNFTSFELPKNFFSFVNIEVIASNGICGSAKMLPIQIKPENTQEILSDEFNKPSFEFREIPYTIEGDTVKLFTDNFTIDSVHLNYYRYPIQFDIEGYVDEFGNGSINVAPEFEDRIVDRIISMCITSFDINNENFNKLQADINRVVSKL